jgi:hypothetical protein
MKVLEILVNGGIIGGVCYTICFVFSIIGRCYVCKHSKDMTDDQTKTLSNMMSQNININFHF